MTRRVVIHNHLPVRTRDGEPKPSDPDFERWKAQQQETQNKGGGKFYADSKYARDAQPITDLQRYSGDVIWLDVSEVQFNKLQNGGPAGQVEGRTATVIEKDSFPTQFSGRKYRVKVRLK